MRIAICLAIFSALALQCQAEPQGVSPEHISIEELLKEATVVNLEDVLAEEAPTPIIPLVPVEVVAKAPEQQPEPPRPNAIQPLRERFKQRSQQRPNFLTRLRARRPLVNTEAPEAEIETVEDNQEESVEVISSQPRRRPVAFRPRARPTFAPQPVADEQEDQEETQSRPRSRSSLFAPRRRFRLQPGASKEEEEQDNGEQEEVVDQSVEEEEEQEAADDDAPQRPGFGIGLLRRPRPTSFLGFRRPSTTTEAAPTTTELPVTPTEQPATTTTTTLETTTPTTTEVTSPPEATIVVDTAAPTIQVVTTNTFQPTPSPELPGVTQPIRITTRARQRPTAVTPEEPTTVQVVPVSRPSPRRRIVAARPQPEAVEVVEVKPKKAIRRRRPNPNRRRRPVETPRTNTIAVDSVEPTEPARTTVTIQEPTRTTVTLNQPTRTTTRILLPEPTTPSRTPITLTQSLGTTPFTRIPSPTGASFTTTIGQTSRTRPTPRIPTTFFTPTGTFATNTFPTTATDSLFTSPFTSSPSAPTVSTEPKFIPLELVELQPVVQEAQPAEPVTRIVPTPSGFENTVRNELPRKFSVTKPTKKVKTGSRNKVEDRYRTENDDGSITWGYKGSDGSFKEETIGADCITRGRYGYVDPRGKVREFTYTSGIACDPETKVPLAGGRQINKKAKVEQSKEARTGYYDYRDNRFVLPDGRRVRVEVNAANRARG